METRRRTPIDRRTFIAGSAAVLGSALFAGCSGAPSEEPASLTAPESEAPIQDAIASSPDLEQESPSTAAGGTLLVYFSRAGMNYAASGPVHTDVGNTAVVAGYLQDLVDCDVYEIEAAEPYPYEYEAATDQAQREKDANARPAIAAELPDLSGYDTLLVGSGVWWGGPPMIMRTFFEALDTAGKTIVPFTTHAGSGLGSAVQTYRELCPEAAVESNGLAVRGEDVRNARAEVEAWVSELGLA